MAAAVLYYLSVCLPVHSYKYACIRHISFWRTARHYVAFQIGYLLLTVLCRADDVNVNDRHLRVVHKVRLAPRGGRRSKKVWFIKYVSLQGEGGSLRKCDNL